MTKETQLVDILRVEGIMAQGYGMNPKILMRDKRLSIEAKSIYNYIASFAGGGNQAFPSRDIMLDELKISKNRYYKHLKDLIDADYIRIEKSKQGNGMYDRNIYTIVALPNPAPVEESALQNEDKTERPTKQNNKTEEKQKKPLVKKLQVRERASVNELRERLEIDNLKQSDPDNAELIEDVFMAVEDMNASEQISISGNVKKKEAIQELLNQLTADNIRLVTHIMAKNKKPLINRKSYIQTCIANSIFDVRSKNIEAKNIIDAKQQEEAEEKKKQKKVDTERQELIDAYQKHPELKKLDQDITEVIKKMSKAVLCKNDILLKKLEKEKERLLEEREKYGIC